MTDDAAVITQTQAPLRAAPDPEPKKKQDPTYSVFRKVEVDAEVSGMTYVLLTEQIKAPSRKEAVRRATEKVEQAMKGGTFLVIPADAIKTLTRTTRTETVDDFA